MAGDLDFGPGGPPVPDVSALVRAWRLVEPSAPRGERVLAFESWESFATLVTAERRHILRHLHDHPEACVSALANALGRPFPLVHEDVMVLEMAGLIDRTGGALEVTADRFSVVLAL
jgi:predicted transcriptional regulator